MTPPLELFDDGQSTSGYWRRYAFSAEPGSVWVQHVDTEITCYSQGQPWLRFSNSYGEYFVLDGAGGLGGPGAPVPWFDLHAFDVLQDGWGRAGLRSWLRHQPGQERQPPTRLEVEKRFRLARGTLADVAPTAERTEVGEFGYLGRGPFGAPRSVIEFCFEPRAELSLDDPNQRSAQGNATPEGQTWEALERYVFNYPHLSGELLSASPYELLAPERTAP